MYESEIAVIQKCVRNIKPCHGCNKVPPHPNVAFAGVHGKYIADGGETDHFSTISNFQPTLESFLKKNENEEITKTVLLQLAHALDHIHRKGWAHGDIRLSNIYLSDSQEKIVLKHPKKLFENDKQNASQTTEETRQQREKDITDLQTVFNAILKMNKVGEIQGTDYRIAEDLLNYMKQKQIDTKQMLQHPYFWDVEKKLTFLSKITQFSKSGDVGKPVKDTLNKRSGEVIGAQGWIRKLEIIDTEELDGYSRARVSRKRESEKKRTKCENPPTNCTPPSGRKKRRKKTLTVSSGAIKNFTDKEKCKDEPLYKEHKLQSLLNFIRNRWEHYWEDSREVQACFGYDHAHGFWKFFSRRFPELFLVVYDVIRSQKSGWNFQGITDIYFETIAKNGDLPKLS